MDPLSDALSLLKVESLLTARIEVRGPWALRFAPMGHLKFAGVFEGSFWLWSENGEPPLKLEAGDFYLLTRGQAYCAGSHPLLHPVDGREVTAAFRCPDGIVRYGESGELTSAAGGLFTFNHKAQELLLNLLPPLVHVPAASTSATALRAVLELLRLEPEANTPGKSVAALSLANMVLVQILRAYVASASPASGWLGALADAKIGAAIYLMHSDIAHPWKVGELAASAAMSRSSFTERFKALVGVPPLHYLIRWRMAVAGAALSAGKSLSETAESVGYLSDTAFSTAFKRSTGRSPGRYRSMAQRSAD